MTKSVQIDKVVEHALSIIGAGAVFTLPYIGVLVIKGGF